MNKEQQFKVTLDEVRRSKSIYNEKKHYIEPNMNAELCTDLQNEWLSSAWQKFKTYDYEGSLLAQFLKDKFNLKRCKKSEATALLFIGKYAESGAYIKEQTKHYWLCSISAG
ncbi:hypothetical protein [Chryseobacterium sp.]|uniref:hypothetical protein n=1 Tax=Chryseobacterium sp. TaxID=1871047 RepID=UPI00289C28BC|nr:hypothetical protein [Chryseobacterium sp.]